MRENREAISRLLSATSPLEVQHALSPIGLDTVLWQSWDADRIRTWDGFPKGFLEHYYGTDADRFCPYATAVRRGWESFTFLEAKAVFGNTPDAKRSDRVKRAFGITDGIVIRSGRALNRSVLIFGLGQPARPVYQKYREVMAVAAIKMDGMLLEHEGLIEIPRQFYPISEKQREVLKVQIEHPELSPKEQADMLGISLRMLQKRHSQIADRFGVSSFAGAVAIASTDSSVKLTAD